MKYSSVGKKKWTWTPDALGSDGYNILGALECSLINLSLIQNVSDWHIDEMERFSYKYCGDNNLLPSPNKEGFINVPDDNLVLRSLWRKY